MKQLEVQIFEMIANAQKYRMNIAAIVMTNEIFDELKEKCKALTTNMVLQEERGSLDELPYFVSYPVIKGEKLELAYKIKTGGLI